MTFIWTLVAILFFLVFLVIVHVCSVISDYDYKQTVTRYRIEKRIVDKKTVKYVISQNYFFGIPKMWYDDSLLFDNYEDALEVMNRLQRSGFSQK